MVTIALLKPLNSKIVIELLHLMLPDYERAMIFWKVLNLRPFILMLDCNIQMQMNMEDQWDDTESGKPKYSEKNLSQCHYVHQESHGLGSKTGLRGERPASNCLSQGTTYHIYKNYFVSNREHQSEFIDCHTKKKTCFYFVCHAEYKQRTVWAKCRLFSFKRVGTITTTMDQRFLCSLKSV